MAVKRSAPVEGQIYKHFKGSLYKVLTIAVHTETADKLVVYQSIEKPDRVFARPLDMFMSEIDRVRYPFVKAKYRFTLLVEESEPEVEETEADKIVEVEDPDDIAIYKADGELVIDPYVEAVLDEKEYSKKIENFEYLRGKCTEDMLTMIAISLDIQLTGDTIEEKYAGILKTLKMHDKYESARLRG